MAGRYVTMTAQPGQGTAVAELMLAVADTLAGVQSEAGRARQSD